MDEWIRVTFPEVRDVLVDGTICGATNRTILVQRGYHVITLGGAQNYTSPQMPVAVYNTSVDAPMVLGFSLP